jgi:RNA-directed DNA polymerase
MAEMPDRPRREGGGTAKGMGIERQADAARDGKTGDGAPMLMEEVVRRGNLTAAYERVVRNGGAPGVDGMTVDDLMPYCREHWARIRKELLGGKYRPQSVRKVEIPKPGGGVRSLGIPTVLPPDDPAGLAPGHDAHL